MIDTDDDREVVGEYGRTSNLKVSEYREIPVQPKKIVKGCRPGQALGDGHFVYKGKGGLPHNPYQLRTEPAVWQDIRLHHLETENTELSIDPSEPITIANLSQTSIASQTEAIEPTQEIIEAKGWTRDDKGRVLLTATTPKYVSNKMYQPSAIC